MITSIIDKGYCLIYRDKDGDNDIKWGVRISLSFTLLNAFLSIAEYTNPGIYYYNNSIWWMESTCFY